jgi:hypothetical protein
MPSCKPLLDLGWRGALKKQFHRFLKISTSLLDGVALTRDIKLGTEGDIALVFRADYGG